MQKKSNTQKVKPFLKWAGGKKQSITELENHLPQEIKISKSIPYYFEPLIGGGAFFFYLMSHYKIKEAFINDINSELILTYKVIKKDPKKLIENLKIIEDKFINKNKEERKEYYYNKREYFNNQLNDFDFKNYSEEHIDRASLMIFMNRTCFNGLFRVNRQGRFNVPMGEYKKPKICDEKNILNVSKVLKNTKISNLDYSELEELINYESLVYLDPPYRPLNETSHFINYSTNEFTDKQQIELSKFYHRISDKGAKALLSNSDPKNVDPNDNFFDNLYSDYKIDRIKANRSINSKGNKRGNINELLIYNY